MTPNRHPAARNTAPTGSTLPTRRAALGALAATTLLLAGCGPKKDHRQDQVAAAVNGSTTPAADLTVMIIRHGEKPAGSEQGHDDSGKPSNSSLTDRGWQRADALPRLFTPQPTAGLHTPAKIYAAADSGPHAGAHRMRQTVTPLAHRLGLTVDLGYSETQESALAKAVAAQPGPVLICWEHSRIPAIARAIAPSAGAPAGWPDRFDLVWVFTRTGGVWSFHQLDQHLLPGDA
ncbi:hypothetical protein CFP65_0047 [Kitasatospora sp. MMS16-BH015]|uniref:phosphoglycerate mutase family protein n=1 Tax=Kitasatospora sp. MMS16-BH015 TaxID=2018025 RepID=UPI000CA24C1F|nr:phosphoglycerate mutase family protein [Kitasatospora sp. MMS16-BH015]AUG75033.1 hypothetical protein CFP65_0047 [Kitasatospora sp. MMS16-BH015]